MTTKRKMWTWAAVVAALALVFLIMSVAQGQSERNQRQQIEQSYDRMTDAYLGNNR
jgi:uncharacterized membrane protein affecting hemolysin expression